MTAVAVWDHAPTADELLAARVAAGWRPTPTATREGDVILGHAACLLPGADLPGK
ncbi:hypothetical protein SAMN02745121_02411 [Nannocystis exedens]|uniref:Uncharacterized protein n=1 Tax=Nannocystis exedens TaxID=54 RepID=A0A1I1WP20_9BACT|nr:hypothetical protein [Nannocystis exedens]PCC67775.1 hypothetical protein NAEX_00783 [Nannocystis exedens]SFD95163.1 hypothetical protein SAMN02745121_02411 [Nannocystis exedens]